MESRTICPQCSPGRKKGNERCMARDGDLFYCHHCGYKSGGQPALEITVNPIKDEFLHFFNERGITGAVLKRNGVTSNAKEILFPYYEHGNIVNVKYRTLDKKFRQEKGRKKIFYGLDDIRSEKEIIIVEGELDKLSIEVAGFKNCISVPDGAPMPETKSYQSKFDYIKTSEEYFKDTEKIILALDNDAPGNKLESELIRRFGPERCWRVTWPEGCKDANDVLLRSRYILFGCIKKAIPVPVEGIFTVDDVSKDIDSLYENGYKQGDSTGWLELDKYYTVSRGHVTIITGIPSHGKSTWLDALIVNLAQYNEWRFSLFSPENQPIQQHVSQIAKCYIGKQFSKIYNGYMSKDDLDKAKDWMRSRFYFILPPDDQLTVDNILEKAKITITRYGITGLIIDPWNELDHARKPQYTETEYVSLCLTKIRRFARKYDIHIWVVAHPTKMQKDRSGNYGVPTPYDISGSANFRNKPDFCICVWRDLSNESSAVEIHIQKARFRHLGKIGHIELYFDFFSNKYSEKING